MSMDRLLVEAYHFATTIGSILSDATNVGGIAISEGPTAAVSEGVYRASYKFGEYAWGAAGRVATYLATFPDYIVAKAATDWEPNYLFDKTISIADKASEGLGKLNNYATEQLLNGEPKPYPEFSAAHLIAPSLVFISATKCYSNYTRQLVNNLMEKTTVTCYDSACANRSERKSQRHWGDIAKSAAGAALSGFVSYTAAQGIIRQLPEQIHPAVNTAFDVTLAIISLLNIFNSVMPTSSSPTIEEEEACCADCQEGNTCASFRATAFNSLDHAASAA